MNATQSPSSKESAAPQPPASASGFFSQPCQRYRNFQIIFTFLTLNFAIPAVGYSLFPGVALDAFVQVNALFGGSNFDFADRVSHFWRHLGAANVMTLALCCLLLQIDLRRFFPVLYPLAFMKLYVALSWLMVAVQNLDVPFYLAAALLDVGTFGVIVFFAVRAHREITARTNEPLVPTPRGDRRRY
jgi:hypothetical protein